MSSFVRRIQRSVKRAKNPACRALHFMGRGSKLGVKNPPRPKRKPKVKVRPRNAAERAVTRKASVANMKARVAVTYRAPTRAERAAVAPKHAHYHDRPKGYRVLANLSKRHPDYGCTPAEHARRKAGKRADG